MAQEHSLRFALPITLGIVYIAAAMFTLAAMELAAPFRTDIPKGSLPSGGRSEIWQWNVFNPNNYSPEGKWAYRRLIAAQIFSLVALIGCILSIRL